MRVLLSMAVVVTHLCQDVNFFAKRLTLSLPVVLVFHCVLAVSTEHVLRPPFATVGFFSKDSIALTWPSCKAITHVVDNLFCP